MDQGLQNDIILAQRIQQAQRNQGNRKGGAVIHDFSLWKRKGKSGKDIDEGSRKPPNLVEAYAHLSKQDAIASKRHITDLLQESDASTQCEEIMQESSQRSSRQNSLSQCGNLEEALPLLDITERVEDELKIVRSESPGSNFIEFRSSMDSPLSGLEVLDDYSPTMPNNSPLSVALIPVSLHLSSRRCKLEQSFQPTHLTDAAHETCLKREVSRTWQKGRLIGNGTFGQVYLGLEKRTGKLFAIKQIPLPSNGGEENEAEKFCKEINLMKDLHHEHIVKYLGADQDEYNLYIFLEYVPGGSIATMLSQFGPFKEDLIRKYMCQICLGMEYLHSQGIAHRDIKGANVLVNEQGVAKLADFGSSRQIQHMQIRSNEKEKKGNSFKNRPDLSFKGSSSVRGSVPWMAPEVIRGSGHGRSADIWSAGATMIEMASAHNPWPQITNRISGLYIIGKTRHPPPIPDLLSKEGKGFLRKCFRLNPKDRPSALELLESSYLKANTSDESSAGGTGSDGGGDNNGESKDEKNTKKRKPESFQGKEKKQKTKDVQMAEDEDKDEDTTKIAAKDYIPESSGNTDASKNSSQDELPGKKVTEFHASRGCIAHLYPQQQLQKIKCNSSGCIASAWIHDVCVRDKSEQWCCGDSCKDIATLLNTDSRVRSKKH